MKQLSHLDFAHNQIINALAHNSATAPVGPGEGQFYFNTGDKSFYYWNNTTWVNISAVDLSGLIAKSLMTANTIIKADASGTPVALTVSDQSLIGRVSGGAISNITIDSDLSSVSASDDTIPSAKAAKAYADTKQSALTFGIANTNAVRVDDASAATTQYVRFTANGIEGRTLAETLADLGVIPTSYLDTDGTLVNNSDVRISTQKAVKTYIDGIIAAANALVYKGVLDCSANPNYPAADAGAVYVVSVAGLIGGGAGIAVDAGDMLLCKTDGTVTGTHAAVGAQWNLVERNLIGAVTGPTSATDNNVALFNGTTGKLIKDSGVTLASLQNQNATHTGDVTGSVALTIANAAVTLAKMANLPANTIIGNNTGSSATPVAMTVAQTLTLLGVAAGSTSNPKVTANIGDGTTTTFAVTHSLGTRDFTFQIYTNGAPYDEVIVDNERTDLNTLTLKFNTAPTTNQYRIVITG